MQEEDPFAEFLSQEQGTVPAPAYTPPEPEQDAAVVLKQLADCAQRQEQLLGQVCGLLKGLDDKVARIAANQERLEASLQQMTQQSISAGAAAATAGVGGAKSAGGPTRGHIVQPPGKPGVPVTAAAPANSFAAGGSFMQSAEEQRLAAEKLALERARIEEENRRREEELAHRREEEERRKAAEAERLRLEEEKRREEERKRKAKLEQKTGSLMSNLIDGSGGSGLFGDDEPKRNSKKGGLFDD